MSGTRTNITQIRRTPLPNNPPAAGVLMDGELCVEQNTPVRLWVGVPTSLDPSGRKLVIDATAIAEAGVVGEAPADGASYGRMNTTWTRVLPLTGGSLTGNLTVGGDLVATGWINAGAVGSNSYAFMQAAAGATHWTGLELGRELNQYGTYLGFNAKGSSRWTLEVGTDDGDDEIGSNAGSNIYLRRYDDTGTELTAPALTITRATGKVDLTNTLTITASASNDALVLKQVGTASPLIEFNAAGTGTQAAGYLRARRNGVNRWTVQIGSTTAETGSNAGSDFTISGWSDTGTLISTPFKITRATGIVDFAVNPTVAGAVFPFLPIGGGTLTGLLTTVSTTVTGTFTVGQTASGNAVMVMNAPAGATRAIRMQSGGLLRWQLSFVTAESTGNAGADLLLTRYDDTGTNLGTVFTVTRSTGLLTLSGGLSYGNVLAAANNDLSKHIALFSTTYGINTTSGRMNFVIGGAAWFVTNAGADIGSVTSTGINAFAIGVTTPAAGTFTSVKTGSTAGPTWTTGTGAPAATQPVGSIYSRTDGTAGARLYVSAGAGTWTPVATV